MNSSNTNKFEVKEIIELLHNNDLKKKKAMSNETNSKNVPRNEKAYFNSYKIHQILLFKK